MEENSWCDERYGDCCGSTSRFESMLRLLMFLETELEFKEEVIDLLLVCIFTVSLCTFLGFRMVRF